MPVELTLLTWAIVLGIVHLLVVGRFVTAKNGATYGLGPRDAPPVPLAGVEARCQRALDNFRETFPWAAAAILIAALANRHSAWTVSGAHLYFWGRLVYVPLYMSGVPGLRTVAWLVATLGILLILVGIGRG